MDSPLSTRAIILRVLSFDPGYGSDLIDRAEELYDVRLSAGSVYPCLSSLEEDGHVRRRDVLTSTRACYFELTKKGRDLASDQRTLVALVFGLERISFVPGARK